MMNHILKIFATTAIGIFLLFGCATDQNLFNKRVYTLNEVPNYRTYLTRLRVVEDDGAIIVSGRLRPKRTHGGINIPDYVTIVLINQEGDVIDSRNVPYIPIPKIFTGRDESWEARFSATFYHIPPPGTIIQLSNIE